MLFGLFRRKPKTVLALNAKEFLEFWTVNGVDPMQHAILYPHCDIKTEHEHKDGIKWLGA